MVFKNNNTEIVKKITNRSIKGNKTRNIFILISTVLTTFMLAFVLTMSYNLMKNTAVMYDRLNGVSADIVLNNPTNEQIEYVKNNSDVKSSGILITSGKVESGTLEESNKKIELDYYDNESFENLVIPAIDDITGKYPTEYNQIMLSTASIEYLGLDNCKIGDTIELVVKNVDKTVDTENFIISGTYYDYATGGRNTKAFVSEEYIIQKGQTAEESGYVMLSTKFLKGNDVLNNLETNLNLDKRQSISPIFFQARNYTDIIIVAIVAVIFLIFTGFLLTYNVVQISVNRDINFYGLLKTIGISPTQIKKVVKNQVINLSLVGIPIGVILSYLVCLGLYSGMSTIFYAKDKVAMPMTVDMNIFIIIFTILFSLLTIYLSCRKPAKIASRVSPVEAVRYTGVENDYKKKSRKTTNGSKLYKMAWYNVFRNGKRSMIVFVSLFMGVMTFLGAETFTSSLNMDNYLKFYYPYDVTIEEDGGVFTDDLINEIKNTESVSNLTELEYGIVQIELDDEIIMPGIKQKLSWELEENEVNAECSRLKSENNGFAEADIVGIDDKMAEMIYNINNEAFDLEAFKQGDIAFIWSWYVQDKNVGDVFNTPLEIKSIDNSAKDEFKVISIETTGPFRSVYNTNNVPCIYVSKNTLEELSDNIQVDSIYFNCDTEIEKDFVNMASNNGWYISLKSVVMDGMQKSIFVMNAIGSAIGFVLILIGVLNFINIIVTNMDSRKTEFAFLESIGMTKKQINQMITYEGLYYAIVTSVLTLTLGSGILFFIGHTMEGQDPYIEYKYPLGSVIIILLIIYAICLITPKIVYKKTSKGSIVERSKN